MEKLYTHTEDIHNTRAAEVVVPVVLDMLPAKSVLDVGCGTGTWLKVLNQNFGLTDLVGLDGSYINGDQLVIDRRYFKEADLRLSFDLKRKFDLVFCLEVAEHLPEAVADNLVECLCAHSSVVVFSAAIPGQGGQNHVNEQWPVYWQQKFLKHGFNRYDLVRPKIWENPRVDVWYKQNIFIFSSKYLDKSPQTLTAEIHPDFWTEKILINKKLSQSLDNYYRGKVPVKTALKTFVLSIINLFRIA